MAPSLRRPRSVAHRGPGSHSDERPGPPARLPAGAEPPLPWSSRTTPLARRRPTATSLCWPGSARAVLRGPSRRQLLCLPLSPLLSPRTRVHRKQEETPAASGGRHTTLSGLQRACGVAGEGKALLEPTPTPAEQRPQLLPLPAPGRRTGQAPRSQRGPRAGSILTIFLAQSQRELSSRAGLQDPFRSSEPVGTPAQPGGEGKDTQEAGRSRAAPPSGSGACFPRGGKVQRLLCRGESCVWGVPGGTYRDPLLSGNIAPHHDPPMTRMPRKSGFARGSHRKPRAFLLARGEKQSHPTAPEVPSAHGQAGRHAPPGQEATTQQTTGLAAHGGRSKRSSPLPESPQGPAASPGSCVQPPTSEEQRGGHPGASGSTSQGPRASRGEQGRLHHEAAPRVSDRRAGHGGPGHLHLVVTSFHRAGLLRATQALCGPPITEGYAADGAETPAPHPRASTVKK